MKVVAIIQSRMGATRLPGKVLEDLAGQPMLARVVHRTRLAKTLNTMVVATTTQAADDVIVNLCEIQTVERSRIIYRVLDSTDFCRISYRHRSF